MSWLFLMLFLFGGDFSAPERILAGSGWIESRLTNDSAAGLSELVTNEAARLDLRLAAMARLDQRHPFQAGECARVLLASPDPVLRVMAGDLLGKAPPAGDDRLWERSLRAMPAEANLRLIVDYRQASNLVSIASLVSNQGSTGSLRRGLEQMYGLLHFARIRRFAMSVVTNSDNQPEGSLLVAEGAFSLRALERMLVEAGAAGEVEDRGGWKLVATPLAMLILKDDWMVAGFGGNRETMGRLVEGWFARLQAGSGLAAWMGDNAGIQGGMHLLLSDGAVQSLLSQTGIRDAGHGRLELRLRSLAAGDFELRFSHPGRAPLELAGKIRDAVASLPARVPGLDADALGWVRTLRIELGDGDLVVSPSGRCDLRQFVRLLFSGAGVQ